MLPAYHCLIAYQPETEGHMSRMLYDSLHRTHRAGDSFKTFLDQYDLVEGGSQESCGVFWLYPCLVGICSLTDFIL